MKARMESGLIDTAVYPSAYSLPNQPGLIFCDLQGCTDADTAEMCDLFLKLRNISISLLKQDTPANPRMYDTIAAIL
jgi:hypothetical protein